MLDSPVGSQGPHHQVGVALRAADPLAEPLPVGVTLPCRPQAVGFHRVPPKHAAMMNCTVLCIAFVGKVKTIETDLRL